jgi:hexosaminidase
MSNPQKVEYMIFPRMSALSEVLWSPKDKRNLEEFKQQLPEMDKRYELWRANYFKE